MSQLLIRKRISKNFARIWNLLPYKLLLDKNVWLHKKYFWNHLGLLSLSDYQNGYMSFKVPSQIHAGQMRLKYMCLSCGKMFGKEQPVKIHLNVHYGDNIYNCRFCEKVFANYSAFEVSNEIQFRFFWRQTNLIWCSYVSLTITQLNQGSI